jgi:hypothetical protein
MIAIVHIVLHVSENTWALFHYIYKGYLVRPYLLLRFVGCDGRVLGVTDHSPSSNKQPRSVRSRSRTTGSTTQHNTSVDHHPRLMAVHLF